MAEFEFNKKYRSAGGKGNRVAILVGPSPDVEGCVILKVVEGVENSELFIEVLNMCNGMGWTEIKEPKTVIKWVVAYRYKDHKEVLSAVSSYDKFLYDRDDIEILGQWPVTYVVEE